MAVISMKQLLEAGVHFGHQTRRWNPKMKQYILRNETVFIIDLQQTVRMLENVYHFVRDLARDGGKIIFVGTKSRRRNLFSLKLNAAVCLC